MKSDLIKFYKLSLGVFGATVLAVAAFALLLGGPRTPPPSSPDVSPPAAPQAAPTAAPASAAAILLNGQTVALTADAATAQSVLQRALAHHIGLVTQGLDAADAAAEFITLPQIVETAGEGVVPVSEDQALRALLAREGLGVRVSFLTQEVRAIEAETVVEKDRSLPEGTRILRTLPVEGQEAIPTLHVYENGQEVSALAQEPRLLREKADGLVLEGRLAKAKAGAVPGKNEGKKGREHTALSFAPPVDARIRVYFGGRDGGYHYGLDYGCDPEEPVRAAAAGTVSAVFERASYGLFVELDHGEGFTTRYACLGQASVAVGAQVEAGGIIGVAGEQALHFELRIDGKAYNPRYYLD